MPARTRRGTSRPTEVVPRRGASRPTEVVDLTEQPQETTTTAQNVTAGRKRKRNEIDVEELAVKEVVDQTKTDTTTNKNARSDKETIGKMSCVICMDSYTDATAAACGHVFCHKCLTRALMASEKHHERGAGSCPSCRKNIFRTRANNLIPLNFMKKETYDRMKAKGA